MTKNKKNQEFKIRKIRRNIEYSFRGSDRYFYLFIVFLVAGIVLWAVMHVIFDVCIDSCAYFHERRSLNNFHRDRVITFEQIAE